MPVFMPQANKKDDMGQLMAIGQIAGGAMSGNPMVAAGGVASLSAQDQTATQTPTVASAPMQRRMQMQQEDPVMTLSTAKEALSYQPPDVQKEYASTIDQALKLAQQSRQNARIS